MLKILLDALVLSGIISALRGKDAPEWLTLVLVALGMAIANFVCALLLAPVIGIFVLVPIVLLDGLILMYFCSLTIKQAVITLGILIAYNVVLQLTAAYLFRI
jgi:hypothetical protein